jgi:hypothetical protein
MIVVRQEQKTMRALFFLVCFLPLAPTACGGDDSAPMDSGPDAAHEATTMCIPNEAIPCSVNGCSGFIVCNDAGDRFTACICPEGGMSEGGEAAPAESDGGMDGATTDSGSE